MKVLFISLCVVSIAFGFSIVDEFEIEADDNEDFASSFEEKLYDAISSVDPDGEPATTLVGYSFVDCGGPTAIVNINSISLTPDPVQAPESISATFRINSELAAPIKASVEIKKEIFGSYIKIPCVNNVGSCDYDDLCSFLKNTTSCPFPSLGCTCPFKPNAYAIQPIQFNLPISSALSGKYQLKVATAMDGKVAFCAQLNLSLD